MRIVIKADESSGATGETVLSEGYFDGTVGLWYRIKEWSLDGQTNPDPIMGIRQPFVRYAPRYNVGHTITFSTWKQFDSAHDCTYGLAIWIANLARWGNVTFTAPGGAFRLLDAEITGSRGSQHGASAYIDYTIVGGQLTV